MGATFKVGDPVTVLPPWDDLPYILSFRQYVYVAAIRPDGYMVQFGAAFSPDQVFGPITAHRLAAGWRNEDGRWRIAT